MQKESHRMPADGDGTERNESDEIGELASRRDADMAGGLPNSGESGGGPYPNPHSGKEGGSYEGGQSGGRGYYGNGQLGEDDSLGGNENAGSRDED